MYVMTWLATTSHKSPRKIWREPDKIKFFYVGTIYRSQFFRTKVQVESNLFLIELRGDKFFPSSDEIGDTPLEKYELV